MKPQELQLLEKYFPAAAIPMVCEAYSHSRFNLKFNHPRTSRLGDFRLPRHANELCTITLNQDLNPYQMVVTFVHELAHYTVYINYPRNRESHGNLWKQTFAQLLLPYLKSEIFPDDVLQALRQHLQHIKASSTTDHNLARVMKRYDKHPADEKSQILESLPEGAIFKLKNGLTFRKGPRRRTRYQCECLDNGKTYTVSGLVEAILSK